MSLPANINVLAVKVFFSYFTERDDNMKIKYPPYAVENITIGENPDVQIWCQYVMEPPDLFIPEHFKSKLFLIKTSQELQM